MIDHSELLRQLNYDPNTGLFTWKVGKKSFSDIGRVAGNHINGYVEIRVNMKKHYAHRLAWFYVYGEWPTAMLDHINRVKDDNRISNLRLSDHSQNGLNMVRAKSNSESGVLGVTKRGSRYSAGITVRGQRLSLGTYDTAEAASKAYFEAKTKCHQEYEKQPDNERRVAYVGVTRAKERLSIIQPQSKLYFDYFAEGN